MAYLQAPSIDGRVSKLKRMKELEAENARLKRIFAEAMMDKAVQKGVPIDTRVH